MAFPGEACLAPTKYFFIIFYLFGAITHPDSFLSFGTVEERLDLHPRKHHMQIQIDPVTQSP